jgi:hypothetical protein
MGLFSCVFLIFLIRYWICIYTMYFFICNQCLPPLTLWVWIPLGRGVLNITLCDQICQWFSHGTPVSSTNKTDRHNITEILLKVVLKHHTSNPSYKGRVVALFRNGNKLVCFAVDIEVSHPLSGDKILNSINMFCWFCRLTAYLILVYLSVKYRYFMNRKLKQWWSTILPISTKRTITSLVPPSSHWTHKRPWHIALEIQVLAWDRNKKPQCRYKHVQLNKTCTNLLPLFQ